MKLLFRLVALAVGIGGLSVCAFFGVGMLAFHFDLSRLVAFAVAGAFGLLCLRAGSWLWEGSTFRNDLRKVVDVLTTAVACLGIIALAQVEKVVGGSPRAVIELLAVGIVVIAYFGLRRKLAPVSSKPKA